MKSIMQDFKECYICHTRENLQLHHIYGAYDRKASDRNGFTVWLCLDHHTGRNGVHGHPEELRNLRVICEMKWLSLGHTEDEFIKLIGKNYIKGDEE